MKQSPKNEKIDLKGEFACLRWTIYNGMLELFINFKTDTDNLNIVVNRYQKNFIPRN